MLVHKDPHHWTHGEEGLGVDYTKLPDVVRRHLQHEEPVLARARLPRRRLLHRALVGRVVARSRLAGDSRERAARRGARPAPARVQADGRSCSRRSSPTAGGIVYLLLFNSSNPAVTAPNFTLALLLMVVIGGAGSRWGAVARRDPLHVPRRPARRGRRLVAVQGLPKVLRTPLEQPLFLLGVDLHPHRRSSCRAGSRASRRAAGRAGCAGSRRRFAPAAPSAGRRRPALTDRAGGRMTSSRTRSQGAGEPLLLIQGLGYGRTGWGPAPDAARASASRSLRSTTAASARATIAAGAVHDRAARRGRRSRVLDELEVERAHVLGDQPRRDDRAGARARRVRSASRKLVLVLDRRPAGRPRCRCRSRPWR